MILTEEHVINCRRKKNRSLFEKIDAYCHASKNLYNSTNYLISQCSRISRRLKDGEILDSFEKALIHRINCAIHEYNRERKGKTALQFIDENNAFIADAYFLSWYLKSSENYRNMPYATCSQICIQTLCKAWKSFYHAVKAYQKDPSAFLGYPHKPGYLDKNSGRNWIVFTYQNITYKENGHICFPKCMSGLTVKTKRENIHQVRICTKDHKIRIQLMYERKEEKNTLDSGVMGIDPGVNNLAALCMNTAALPLLINGRPLKSINQYFNKKRAYLQAEAKRCNQQDITKRIRRLTDKRNHKIRDFMHKASRKIIDIAKENRIGTIIIGNNREWKQEVHMGNKTNQSFVNIPHKMLIDMLCYKGALAGIQVHIIDESYTSGTSYLDNETPEKKNYDKSRRKKRGLFCSNSGYAINADVNAAYQIIKKAGYSINKPECVEKVIRVNAA